MTDLLLFVGGLAALVGGAEMLVRGASRLALSLGISPLVVGLTVVALGTSAPEMAVSVGAVINGSTDLAVGNAVGSNIFNVLGILGIAALITPLIVHLQVIRQEVPIMIGSALLLLVLALDGRLGVLDGVLLTVLLAAYVVFLIGQSRAAGADSSADDLPAPAAGGWSATGWAQALLIVVGLALLVGGAEMLVTAAVSFARLLGMSEVVIGLTIVAVGTSMPEVAATVMAAIKGERDMAVGNVVGSCVFNMLGVLGLASLVSGNGLAVPASVMNFDLWVMLAALTACLPIFFTGREVARWEGALFLAYYAAYTAFLILRAQDHEVLPAYSQVMLGFVLPLTVVTLVVTLITRRR
jgi:cation:H+ antiporter